MKLFGTKTKICETDDYTNFSISQILREINFEESRSAKSAIVTHLEALDFNFHEFVHAFKFTKLTQFSL